MRNCPGIAESAGKPPALGSQTPGVVTRKLSVVRNISTAKALPRAEARAENGRAAMSSAMARRVIAGKFPSNRGGVQRRGRPRRSPDARPKVGRVLNPACRLVADMRHAWRNQRRQHTVDGTRGQAIEVAFRQRRVHEFSLDNRRRVMRSVSSERRTPIFATA
jgi:hypothetical protein